jgi:hypothetical protein
MNTIFLHAVEICNDMWFSVHFSDEILEKLIYQKCCAFTISFYIFIILVAETDFFLLQPLPRPIKFFKGSHKVSLSYIYKLIPTYYTFFHFELQPNPIYKHVESFTC